jgi:hypothetical protein
MYWNLCITFDRIGNFPGALVLKSEWAMQAMLARDGDPKRGPKRSTAEYLFEKILSPKVAPKQSIACAE